MKQRSCTLFSLLVLFLFPPLTALAQTSLEVLVNSRGGNTIQRYDLSGTFLGNFIAPGAGNLSLPEDILFHPDGTVLVTGFGNAAIKRFDAQTGNFIGDFSSGYALSAPSKMSIGPDSLIYVTQWGTVQNKVVRFDLQGAFVDEFTGIGAPKGMGHVWDSAGNFYVALYDNGANGTVQKFDTAGNSLGAFVNSAVLQGPTNIWWDANGDLLVEDWTTGKVLRYDTGGQYLSDFVTGLSNPEGIAFLPDGKMLIGDWGQDAVHLIDTNGTVLGLFCSGNGLIDPNCVRIREAPPVGIGEPVVERPFVYPTMGDVFRIVPDPEQPDAMVRVLDISGRVVARPGTATSWHAETIPGGIYLIRREGQGRTAVQRVLVHHF